MLSNSANQKYHFSFHYKYFKQIKSPFLLGCTTVPRKTPFFWPIIFWSISWGFWLYNFWIIQLIFMCSVASNGCVIILFKAKIVWFSNPNMLLNELYKKTSSAVSAPLGDTSWARMIIKLGPSYSLKIICGFMLQAGTWQIAKLSPSPACQSPARGWDSLIITP